MNIWIYKLKRERGVDMNEYLNNRKGRIEQAGREISGRSVESEKRKKIKNEGERYIRGCKKIMTVKYLI